MTIQKHFLFFTIIIDHLKEQCATKEVKIGAITDLNELQNNLNINCVPITIFEMNHENYKAFIEERRIMMAQKIKAYYESL